MYSTNIHIYIYQNNNHDLLFPFKSMIRALFTDMNHSENFGSYNILFDRKWWNCLLKDIWWCGNWISIPPLCKSYVSFTWISPNDPKMWPLAKIFCISRYHKCHIFLYTNTKTIIVTLNTDNWNNIYMIEIFKIMKLAQNSNNWVALNLRCDDVYMTPL